MKFKNIYNETKENVELSLLSLWTPGRHRMRSAIRELFRREPLLAEPVFESIFPWEPTADPDWRSYLAPEVIQIQEEKAARRGETYVPFKHQAESWKALTRGDSIVVTSGTGSGKTECFMLPVLSDLFSRNDCPMEETPVEALFLYPLNALMQDQKTRLGKDCQRLGLRFAVYNRSLGDNRPRRAANPDYANAEVRTRERVRHVGRDENEPACPQILLTNPSMLEFMLVRDKDMPIFERSRGKLRWIIIDEAHTYTGSAAVELAYQIKRVLSAFGVTRDQVRFVCTSATIGDKNNPQELLDFIETLVGPYSPESQNQLVHIDGNRLVPPLEAPQVQEALDYAEITATNAARVLDLRTLINESPLRLSSIMKVLGASALGIDDALDLLDRLCDIQFNNNFLLMLRGHFFMRMIDGLYACVNDQCEGGLSVPSSGIKHLTTNKGSGHCPHCGAPLFELVQCGDCKEFLLECEENAEHLLRPAYTMPEAFSIDAEEDLDAEPEDDDQENGGPMDENWLPLYLSWYGEGREYKKPHPNFHESKLALHWDGNDLLTDQNSPSKPWVVLENRSYPYCPTCAKGGGSDGRRFSDFRLSANWLNGIVAPALMREGADAYNEWGKYIAFTDSRQGTAIYAKRFNADAERAYARTRLVSELSTIQINPVYRPAVEAMMENGTPVEECYRRLGIDPTQKPVFSMRDAAEVIFNQEIFEHLEYEAEYANRDHSRDEDAYRTSLIRGIVGRKSVHLASIENLGLGRVVYPGIDRETHVPAGWAMAGLQLEAWKSFLKISLDYVFRMGNHLQCPTFREKQYLRDSELSIPFNPANWPNVKRTGRAVNVKQHRLVLLICAALGIKDRTELDARENEVNTLLNEAWSFLSGRILKRVDANDRYYNRGEEHPYDGWYYLDMSLDSGSCKLKILEEGWLCPVTNTILDTIFAGYSPNLAGTLCPENLDRFRVGGDAKVEMPIPGDDDFSVKTQALVAAGIWNDRHKYAYLDTKQGYLTAEHSGQQNRDILDRYTEEFKSEPRHLLNLLQCSTTMEMGVDIGDIDLVLMTNIPPTTANYMQRAGRAGRRGQNRAASFSFCPNTAIGAQAFKSPMGILTGVNPASRPVVSEMIVQRHMNSFFIREYLCSSDGAVKFNNIHSWLRTNGVYVPFCAWLKEQLEEAAFVSAFTSVFGGDRLLTQAIDVTCHSLSAIAERYQTILDDIDQAIEETEDQAKKDALSIQAQALKKQDPKSYLAEEQFLPNAAMPTGVVEFNHLTAKQYERLEWLKERLSATQAELENGELSAAERNDLEKKCRKLEVEINDIVENAISSREIRIALSEYAPGQTVVIDEKNHMSAGIEWTNSLGQRQPWKYLYHCPTCGRYEYSEDPTLTQCPHCMTNYEGYLFPNNTHMTYAIEPARFRADVNQGISRQEETEKFFFDIKTILTDVEWEDCLNGPMCDLVGSEGSNGEIVFVNAGLGEGFSLCLECGKMSASPVERTAENWPHYDIGEKGKECLVNPRNNILLCGRFPTSFVSLRFYKDPGGTLFESDPDLLASLGVLLCRALANLEGISVDDIDFDIRQEYDIQRQVHYASIFIYDTQKGGCNYSTRLLDALTRQKVFNKAKTMLASYACHCEDHIMGACVNCLIDRRTQRMERHLSKFKLLEWFSRLPAPAQPLPQGTTAVPILLKYLVTRLYCATSTRSITFCVDAGEMNLDAWAQKDGPMGRILGECARRGILARLLVANIPQNRPEEMLPFIDLPSKFQNWGTEVRAVTSIGTPDGGMTALIVNDQDHYFTNQPDTLPFTQDWGEHCTSLFENQTLPDFDYSEFPSAQSMLALMQPNETIRTGTVRGDVSTTVGRFFSSVIRPRLLQDGDEQAIRDILGGKNVSITFSDSYVNSALAGLMLVYLIKEMSLLYGFQVSSVNLQIQGPKRQCDNSRWNQYTWITYNFATADDADDYIQDLFSSVLDIEPYFSGIVPSHYRWIRLRPEDSTSYVEIRPDYGICGGWLSDELYRDIDRLDDTTAIKLKSGTTLVYYLLLKR